MENLELATTTTTTATSNSSQPGSASGLSSSASTSTAPSTVFQEEEDNSSSTSEPSASLARPSRASALSALTSLRTGSVERKNVIQPAKMKKLQPATKEKVRQHVENEGKALGIAGVTGVRHGTEQHLVEKVLHELITKGENGATWWEHDPQHRIFVITDGDALAAAVGQRSWHSLNALLCTFGVLCVGFACRKKKAGRVPFTGDSVLDEAVDEPGSSGSSPANFGAAGYNPHYHEYVGPSDDELPCFYSQTYHTPLPRRVKSRSARAKYRDDPDKTRRWVNPFNGFASRPYPIPRIGTLPAARVRFHQLYANAIESLSANLAPGKTPVIDGVPADQELYREHLTAVQVETPRPATGAGGRDPDAEARETRTLNALSSVPPFTSSGHSVKSEPSSHNPAATTTSSRTATTTTTSSSTMPAKARKKSSSTRLAVDPTVKSQQVSQQQQQQSMIQDLQAQVAQSNVMISLLTHQHYMAQLMASQMQAMNTATGAKSGKDEGSQNANSAFASAASQMMPPMMMNPGMMAMMPPNGMMRMPGQMGLPMMPMVPGGIHPSAMNVGMNNMAMMLAYTAAKDQGMPTGPQVMANLIGQQPPNPAPTAAADEPSSPSSTQATAMDGDSSRNSPRAQALLQAVAAASEEEASNHSKPSSPLQAGPEPVVPRIHGENVKPSPMRGDGVVVDKKRPLPTAQVDDCGTMDEDDGASLAKRARTV